MFIFHKKPQLSFPQLYDNMAANVQCQIEWGTYLFHNTPKRNECSKALRKILETYASFKRNRHQTSELLRDVVLKFLLLSFGKIWTLFFNFFIVNFARVFVNSISLWYQSTRFINLMVLLMNYISRVLIYQNTLPVP